VRLEKIGLAVPQWLPYLSMAILSLRFAGTSFRQTQQARTYLVIQGVFWPPPTGNCRGRSHVLPDAECIS
jgi:hypothetical protein